jgi:[acyl-carrier-protein] S-malonyltransferase
MASAQPKLKAELAKAGILAPAAPVISNVTAQPHGAPDQISARLVEQVTSSVRWEESMRYLLAQGFTRFIELGPGAALSGFMRRIDRNAQMPNVADVPSLEATVKALVRDANARCVKGDDSFHVSRITLHHFFVFIRVVRG